VLWQTEAPFSAGANLAQAVPVVMAGDFDALENTVAKFQHTTAALRYSAIPVVAAAQGLALGGGCEFLMHCDRVVAALESYIGLVEVGVGLIPAGGGCKEFALRAMTEAKGGDLLPFLRPYFEAMAMAKVSRSAEEAKQLGHLKPLTSSYSTSTSCCMSPRPRSGRWPRPATGRRSHARFGWRAAPASPPVKWRWSTCAMAASSPPTTIRSGCEIAQALCGGEVDANTLVDEAWLLGLERKGFVELAKTPLTQARIEQMLKTGKPLRN
jgi:3-hydroxyacyl-CoA dehydrogenase